MWQFDGTTATSSLGDFHLSVTPSKQPLQVQAADGNLLATLWQQSQLEQLQLAEAFVRDEDFVARFLPGDAFPFHLELYWSCQALPDAAGHVVSHLVSVRTDLLDTHPEIALTTTFLNSIQEGQEHDFGLSVSTELNATHQLVEFAPREDCPELALEGGNKIERHLFSHFLEKGVIRRARLFALLIPKSLGEANEQALCQELLTADLPLTT